MDCIAVPTQWRVMTLLQILAVDRSCAESRDSSRHPCICRTLTWTSEFGKGVHVSDSRTAASYLVDSKQLAVLLSSQVCNIDFRMVFLTFIFSLHLPSVSFASLLPQLRSLPTRTFLQSHEQKLHLQRLLKVNCYKSRMSKLVQGFQVLLVFYELRALLTGWRNTSSTLSCIFDSKTARCAVFGGIR